MRRVLLSVLIALFCSARVAVAQADAEHLQGTVTKVAGATVTIRTTETQTRTITIAPTAMITRGSGHLTIKDVKVGDRVVVDVDPKTSVATNVELGTAPPVARTPRSAAPSAPPAHAEGQPHGHATMRMSEPGWHYMQDGIVVGTFNRQGGPRGDKEFVAQNWYMGMASRKLGKGTLTLNGMFSLDPATVGKSGYAEIFQAGETLDGRPLVDRQHPHDFFMQLAGVWRIPLTETTGFTIAAGPAGEPALGPVAFMHRASAAENPTAPLGHHTFDSTHISYGVITAAVDHGPWTVEGSLFNGREPDENRWNFDFGPLDSVSGRMWFRPNPQWEFQVSTGRLKEPEALEPGDVTRTTASASWFRREESDFTAVTIAYGHNGKETNGSSGFFAEGTRHFGLNSAYGRFEVQQVETPVLLSNTRASGISPPVICPSVVHCIRGSEAHDTVLAFTVGGVRDVVRTRGFELGLGADVTAYGVPESLKAAYGSSPVSFHVFLRLRPPAPMGRMWNMRMAQPMLGHQMGAMAHKPNE